MIARFFFVKERRISKNGFLPPSAYTPSFHGRPTATATATATAGITTTTVVNAQLETSKSERHVWLMKCPPIISRSLQSPPPNSSSEFSGAVAKVIVTVDPLLPNDNFSSTQEESFCKILSMNLGVLRGCSNTAIRAVQVPREFTMELAATESGNVPKHYSMDMSTDFVPMSVFSESSQGRLSVEGKIYHKFDMKPHKESIEDYGKLCRERTNKYMTKTRQIQVIDNDTGTHMRPMPGMFALKASGPTDKKKLPAKGSDMKRTRRDRGEMEEIMFKLFERQSNWTLKQLLHETDQPEQFLKDLLKDLCLYNNKGANQGTYELKLEYRRSGEEPDSE
ncbi:hypothetical protein RJ639_002908 [Escallonia herrerae]|uniref:TFIIF beta subunit HTH domain-containing protein n=1 Tax=Escallonia herrerae TaxID=1293975 RepID=A0AA88W0C5_9ASTE|nr:hypothetical protein RJ639_002908 [Escallonia herrerae]